ncbi:hypothetical protein ACNOYE_13080 [Nannocystaceae bacterium ST9]
MRGPWSWLIGALVVTLALDGVLALVPAPESATIDRAIDAALAEPGRAIVLAGPPGSLVDVERELGRAGPAHLHRVDASTPVELLAVVDELDRRDPDATIELAALIDLAAFGEAGDEPESTGARVLGWLRTHTPVLRHRARERSDGDSITPLAERLRGASFDDPEHAQVAALDRLLDRLAQTGRPATLILPPLPDRSASEAELDVDARTAELAGRVHARASDRLALLSLDHPLFVDALFDEQGRLDGEGRRIFARNLLHELGLPLATRPEEWSMIHPEGFDRTLIAGVERGSVVGPDWAARFDRPAAIASDDEGRTIVVADTGNHALRVLRGDHRMVETLAGEPGEPGERDGLARGEAQLEQPRELVVLADRVVFVDGPARERLRSVELDPSGAAEVHTLTWVGPRCASVHALRRDREHGRLVLLCDDDRILALDSEQADDRAIELAPADPEIDRVQIEVGGARLWSADAQARLWSAELDGEGRPGPATLRFANASREPLPNRYMAIFPYEFDAVGLDRIVGLQWVERYQSLLVVDVQQPEREIPGLTERVHLRLFDFEREQILPWIKPIAHGDAFFDWNASSRMLVSWFHEGSFAFVESDASLLWLERERSRLVWIADGLLGVAKSGYLHTSITQTDRLFPLCSRSSQPITATYRPDRFLDVRREPLARRGPYVALLVSSSLSTLSDRVDNYDMARLIELELQRELGYLDGVRLDLFHRTWGTASFADLIRNVDEFVSTAAPPDVIFVEVHGFLGRYLKQSREPGELHRQLAELTRLAERYDSLLIFYDNSAIAADHREGLRRTPDEIVEFLAQLHELGFVVIEPSDRLLRELLVESPWGNQPWAKNGHHGATWAIEATAQVIAQMAAPSVREFLRERRPARLDERDPSEFADDDFRALREAWTAASRELAGRELPELRDDYLQVHYGERHVQVFVDLAGYEGLGRDEASLTTLALAVIAAKIGGDVYGDLAERITIELVEFSNYDEYGAGVLESATRVWQRSLTTDELEAFLRERAAD